MKIFGMPESVQLPPVFVFRANHGNLGDAVITEGVRTLFASLGVTVLPSDDGVSPMVVNAAGNLVPAYNTQARFLERLSDTDRQVIILPCTSFGRFPLLRRFRNLTMYCREKETAWRARRNGIQDVRVAHDMAFNIDYSPFQCQYSQSELLAFRVDAESQNDSSPPDGNNDLSAQASAYWDLTSCREAAGQFIRTIACYKRIHTDRLHIAIVAALLGRKVELYANRYYKNRAVYDLSLRSLPNVRFHDEAPQLTDASGNRIREEVTQVRSVTGSAHSTVATGCAATVREPGYDTENSPSTTAFLISLDRARERREKVTAELGKLQLPEVYLLAACDGQTEVNFLSPELAPFRGTAGCLISHLRIYAWCRRHGIRRALIFEDDVTIGDPALARQAVREGESQHVDLCNYGAAARHHFFRNTHAYSISLRAMHAVTDNLETVLRHHRNLHVDCLIEHVRKNNGLSYQWLGHSSIRQDRRFPSTLKWGTPSRLRRQDLFHINDVLKQQNVAPRPMECVALEEANTGNSESGTRRRAKRDPEDQGRQTDQSGGCPA